MFIIVLRHLQRAPLCKGSLHLSRLQWDALLSLVFGGMTTAQWPQRDPFLPCQQVSAMLGKERTWRGDFISGAAEKPLNLLPSPHLFFFKYLPCHENDWIERGSWNSKVEGNNCSWSPTWQGKFSPYSSFSCPRAAPVRPSPVVFGL